MCSGRKRANTVWRRTTVFSKLSIALCQVSVPTRSRPCSSRATARCSRKSFPCAEDLLKAPTRRASRRGATIILLREIHGFALECGCGDFQPVERFSPIHNFVPADALLSDEALRKLPVASYSWEKPSLGNILRRSVAVNHPWQTSRPGHKSCLSKYQRIAASDLSLLAQLIGSLGAPIDVLDKVMVCTQEVREPKSKRRVVGKQTCKRPDGFVCLHDRRVGVALRSFVSVADRTHLAILSVAAANADAGFIDILKWERAVQRAMWSLSIGRALCEFGLAAHQRLEVIAKAYQVLAGGQHGAKISGSISLTAGVLVAHAMPLTSFDANLAEFARCALRQRSRASSAHTP